MAIQGKGIIRTDNEIEGRLADLGQEDRETADALWRRYAPTPWKDLLDATTLPVEGEEAVMEYITERSRNG